MYIKKVLLLLWVTVWGILAHAQVLKVGIKGGANLVKMNGVSFEERFGLGYYGGFFTEVKLGEYWYLQPEVLFAETGVTFSDDFRDIYENLLDINRLSSIKLQRLLIPVTINYKVANIFSLSAGPQFGINISRGEGLLNNAGRALSEGDIGLAAGGNLLLGKFRLNGRYIWGLRSVNNIDRQDNWLPQTAQLGIGFVF